MLKIPTVLFLNCIGSYFYSIVESKSIQSQKYSLLCYLASGSLEYNALNLEEVHEKYGNNEWGYQPVSIRNKKSEILSINDQFYQFMHEYHNVDVTILDMGEQDDFLHILNTNQDSGIYTICNVDEYYISSSDFYQKLHNKHSLLIHNVIENNRSMQIIDSEKGKIYSASFDEMERAFYESKFKRMQLYCIDSTSYSYQNDERELFQKIMSSKFTNKFILQVLSDMKTKLESDSSRYYYKGYYYNVLSKIMPYWKMMSYLTRNSNESLHDLSKELFDGWKDLNHFMLYKYRKNECQYFPVANKLDSIRNKYDCWICEKEKW